MNQTRTLLMFAWLAVAFLLFQEWQRFDAPPPPATPNSLQAPTPAASATASPVPDASSLPAAGSLPALPGASAVETKATVTAQPTITVQSDTLKLRIDLRGGSVVDAELLTYPLEKKPGSTNVHLLTTDPGQLFLAQSGWLGDAGLPAPTHESLFRTEDGRSEYRLADGASTLEVPLVWTDAASGITVRKTLVLTRGSFAVTTRQTVSNTGAAAWRAYPYEQLLRIAPPPPPKHAGLTNPDSFSFVGASWYSPENKFEKRTFDEFSDDGQPVPLDLTVAGGWYAMQQHHFVAAWVPASKENQRYSLAQVATQGAPQYLIRGVGDVVQVPAGASLSRDSVLWIGPKDQKRMKAVHPALRLTVDYGMFTFIAQPLFWLLSWLHALFGNWGWAIIAIVVLLKAALFPLSTAQYKSMAKMRAVQPRIEALKERYGEDRQQFQMAMMELYKKEKINPIGGCLPMLIPIPIFLALYWVLIESVELRQAPWIGWIQNLTASDPYFILPVLNLAVMYLTQKLTPTPGMDPMQKKMMQFMPLVFGVMMAFFPSGLVLYWVTNGLLGLAQQWWMTRQHGDKSPPSDNKKPATVS